MDAIKQTFFQECDEQLAELETGLLAMQNGDSDSETVNAVFRAVHSVKGGAGAFGLDSLVRFAHVFETTLDLMRSDKLTASPELLKAMLRAADVLADLVRGARGGTGPNEQQVAMSAAELAALSTAPGQAAGASDHAPVAPVAVDDGFAGLMFQPVQISTPEPESTPTWHVKFRPHPALYAKGNDAALLLRELTLLGETSVTLDTSDLPDLADLDPEGAYLTWHVDLQTSLPEPSVQEVFEFVEGDCDIEISMAAAAQDATIAEPPPLDVLAFIQQLQAPAVEAAAVTAAPIFVRASLHTGPAPLPHRRRRSCTSRRPPGTSRRPAINRRSASIGIAWTG